MLRSIEERDIRFVRLWFTDVLGFLKSVAVAPAELEAAFARASASTAARSRGWRGSPRPTCCCGPTRRRSRCCPWAAAENGSSGTARMFCDVLNPDGEPAAADPRHVLKRALAKAADQGFTFYTHPEIEFYLFKPGFEPGSEPTPVDDGGYFDHVPRGSRPRLPPRGDHSAREHGHLGGVQPPRGRPGPERDRPALRRRTGHCGQHHDLPDGDQGGRARAGHLRLLHAEAASGAPGFGHAHPHVAVRGRQQRLPRGRRAVPAEPRRLGSSSPGCCGTPARSPPSPTSSSTPTSGCGAAARRRSHLCWGHNNRSALVRVPMYKPGKGQSVRVEHRALDAPATRTSPTPCCSPPGSRASRRATSCPRAPRTTSGSLTDAERRALGIEPLPASLDEAIRAMEGSELVAETLGEQVFDFVLRNKRAEWHDYRAAGHAVRAAALPARACERRVRPVDVTCDPAAGHERGLVVEHRQATAAWPARAAAGVRAGTARPSPGRAAAVHGSSSWYARSCWAAHGCVGRRPAPWLPATRGPLRRGRRARGAHPRRLPRRAAAGDGGRRHGRPGPDGRSVLGDAASRSCRAARPGRSPRARRSAPGRGTQGHHDAVTHDCRPGRALLASSPRYRTSCSASASGPGACSTTRRSLEADFDGVDGRGRGTPDSGRHEPCGA